MAFIVMLYRDALFCLLLPTSFLRRCLMESFRQLLGTPSIIFDISRRAIIEINNSHGTRPGSVYRRDDFLSISAAERPRPVAKTASIGAIDAAISASSGQTMIVDANIMPVNGLTELRQSRIDRGGMLIDVRPPDRTHRPAGICHFMLTVGKA